MALEIVAAAVASLVAPHLGKAADAIVGELGEAAGGIMTSLVEAVRRKLGPGTAPDAAASPRQDSDEQKALAAHLQETMAHDEAFRKDLEQLLERARSQPELAPVVERAEHAGSPVQFNNEITGEVQKIQQVGVVEGNATFS